jgi:hypothetical protein
MCLLSVWGASRPGSGQTLGDTTDRWKYRHAPDVMSGILRGQGVGYVSQSTYQSVQPNRGG